MQTFEPEVKGHQLPDARLVFNHQRAAAFVAGTRFTSG